MITRLTYQRPRQLPIALLTLMRVLCTQGMSVALLGQQTKLQGH